MRVTFHGKYKTDSGSWQPIESDTKIICLDGELRLKGYFRLNSLTEQFLSQQNAPQRTFGIVIMVVSFIMLGVTIFSTILKVSYSGMIWVSDINLHLNKNRNKSKNMLKIIDKCCIMIIAEYCFGTKIVVEQYKHGG